jgi:transposase
MDREGSGPARCRGILGGGIDAAEGGNDLGGVVASDVGQHHRAAGAELRYLPPYSPDFNPIETAFAQIKAFLRKAAARTIPALWRAIGQALDAVTPDNCVNYFANAGYAPA